MQSMAMLTYTELLLHLDFELGRVPLTDSAF